ncbi:MAG: AtpZ/AtpI family protein [Anaerolineae bacterium]
MRKPISTLAFVAQLGCLVSFSVLGCLGLGLWIDRRLGTSPWALLLFMVLGMFLGILIVYGLVAPRTRL